MKSTDFEDEKKTEKNELQLEAVNAMMDNDNGCVHVDEGGGSILIFQIRLFLHIPSLPFENVLPCGSTSFFFFVSAHRSCLLNVVNRQPLKNPTRKPCIE